MKFLAIILLSLLSILWYYISWEYLRIEHIDINQYNSNIITAILIAGTFLFGFLISKIIHKDKCIKVKSSADSSYEEDFFIPEIKEINTTEYQTFENSTDITKDSIDIILDEREENYKHKINLKREILKEELENIEKKTDVVNNTFLNVANNIKRSKKQDLKLIEGIGPKLEILLNKNGIYSYKDLENTEVKKLENILKNGGKRYLKLHNPTTWPKQAILAKENKFEELKKYQKTLVKGIEQ
ncbi:MAG: hypothetical protein Q9M94_04205 [Candidatus Gracilibacteria bacterium]|nr:hypothetical protein [Candidatus Gracilibacteria bacterium]MDQ7022309.1 hypothetical protein [Candidatus Gracilibacteria bacterium]